MGQSSCLTSITTVHRTDWIISKVCLRVCYVELGINEDIKLKNCQNSCWKAMNILEILETHILMGWVVCSWIVKCLIGTIPNGRNKRNPQQ